MSFKTIADVKRANRERAKKTDRAYWFEAGAMRFFNSRIHGGLIRGRYFVTSERYDESYPWRYSLREALPSGQIETVGEFQQFATKEEATAYAKQLVAMNKGVPDNPVKQGFSRETMAQNIRKLAREGYSQKQAVAIAYSAARVSWRRRHVRGPYPSHLRRRPKG